MLLPSSSGQGVSVTSLSTPQLPPIGARTAFCSARVGGSLQGPQHSQGWQLLPVPLPVCPALRVGASAGAVPPFPKQQLIPVVRQPGLSPSPASQLPQARGRQWPSGRRLNSAVPPCLLLPDTLLVPVRGAKTQGVFLSFYPFLHVVKQLASLCCSAGCSPTMRGRVGGPAVLCTGWGAAQPCTENE